MDTAVIVAIVAACTSTASAVMTWLQATRVKRLEVQTQEKLAKLTSTTQLAIERLKIDNERLNKAFAVASEESKPLENILSEMWKHIQIVKDELRSLCESESFNADAIDVKTKSIESAVRILLDLYSQHGAELPEQAAQACHRCKNEILMILSYFPLIAKEVKKDGFISQKTIIYLEKCRLMLDETQAIIALYRSSLRADLLHKVLNVMLYKNLNG